MNAVANPASTATNPTPSTVINAVYEGGHLRLLDPVDLHEGDRVQVQISLPVAQADEQAKPSPTREEVMYILRDIIRHYDVVEDKNPVDEEAIQADIDHATQGVEPLSIAILEERQESL